MYDYEREHLETLRGKLAECTVLLKKDGSFPLPGPCRIAAFGNGVRHTVKGGTGSGEERFRRCIRGGIRKINIATAIFMADARARAETGGQDYFAMSRAAREAVRRTAEEHIRIFGIRKEC